MDNFPPIGVHGLKKLVKGEPEGQSFSFAGSCFRVLERDPSGKPRILPIISGANLPGLILQPRIRKILDKLGIIGVGALEQTSDGKNLMGQRTDGFPTAC